MHKPGTTSGFTLIELLVTTGITAFIILTVSSLFMVFLLSNARTSTRSFVKKEGQYALGRIEFLLRNAKQLETNSDGDICSDDMRSIAFKSIDDSSAQLGVVLDGQTEKIAITSATTDPQFLTSDGVELTDGLRMSCADNNGKKTIEVQFTLTKLSPTLSDQAPSSTEEFRSVIFMRN